MKKRLFSAAMLLITCMTGFAQTQMRKWYIAPDSIFMATPTPAPQTFSTVNAGQSANGFYDYDASTGAENVLFYVADGGVYDYNNTFLGSILNKGSEITIVPFGTNNNVNCERKFNIFTTAGGGQSKVGLYRYVVDMNSYSLTADPNNPIDLMLFGNEFGAIAVSQVVGSDRYLYFLVGSGASGTGGKINKLTIYNNGNVSLPSALYPNQFISNNNSGVEVFARELDLSADGVFLAWASYAPSSITNPTPKYHYLALDPATGDVDISTFGSQAYQQFDIPQNQANDNYANSGFRGVELFNTGTTTRLFMGAGTDGIYFTDLSIPFSGTCYPVLFSKGLQTTTTTYGLSQIEWTSYFDAGNWNQRMYASSDPTGNLTNNIGAFNPAAATPQMLTVNAFTLASPTVANYNLPGNPLSFLYTLPDQIDGEDYSAIVPSAVSHEITVDYYTVNSSNQPTWSYGPTNNPFGATANSTVIITQQLTIKDNTHLTIDGMTFRFSPQAKVVIEAGNSTISASSLTLTNGSVLTGVFDDDPCSYRYTWQGVDVNGRSWLAQNPTNQGQLIMNNNSRIENAECGARISNGGIITAQNESEFLNNKVDVEFKTYHNKTVTNKPTGNLSSFTDCTFKTDDNYLFTTMPVHVSIVQCEGLKFRGCTLANNRTGSYPASLAGYGINAFEGGFSVLPYYSMLQSPNLKPSSFSNFYRGIYTSKSSNNQPFFVSNTTFNNNVVGILNSGVDNAVITNNTFNVSLGNPMSNIQSGIILRHASGFIIEENSFTSVQNATEKRGIIIFNSGASDNEIYKNNFIGLGLANAAIGINHDNNSLAGPYLHGLQYLCNNNQINTNYDFYVSELNEPNYGVNGIRLNQGSQNIPAGNTFSHINNGSSDFYNNTSSSLNYYYSATGNQIPLYINAPFVNKLYVDKENLCPSHINDGTMQNKLTASQVEEIIQTYDSSEAAYLNVLYAYNQLMDGGNTNALLNQIQLSWPQDAWDLRTELLSMSPYLSQDVLREAANRNILPQAMLLEICLANPDATKDMGFIDLLRAEMANPLPQYMIDLIVDSWDESTNRTSLESSLAFFSHQMAMAGNTLLADLYYGNFLINDSLNSNNSYSYNDSLNYWLNRIQTLTAKYDLIESYISTNDMYAAQNELNNIPSNFNLSEDQSQEYDSYLQYFNFRRDVIAAGRTMSELTETEIEQLTTFAESRNNLATVLAQNLLCAYYQICFDVDFEIPESQDRMMHHAANGNSNEINSLQVAPNPAYIQTTFSYNFPLLKESATLLVCDITGRVVKQFTIINHIGQLLWDTRDVTKGLYFYSVKEGKKLFANGKIAVEK